MDVIPRLVLMILQPCNGAECRIITLALGAGLTALMLTQEEAARFTWPSILTGLQTTPLLTIQVRRITLKRERYRVTLEDLQIKLGYFSFPMEGAPRRLTSLIIMLPLTGLRGGGCSMLGVPRSMGPFVGRGLPISRLAPRILALVSAP